MKLWKKKPVQFDKGIALRGKALWGKEDRAVPEAGEELQEQSNETVQFLKTVKEQIVYKPVREEACRELAAHLEDKTEEYKNMGMSREKAAVRAVKEMGDPVSVGVLLNESYALQRNPWLPILILIGVVSGIASNLVYGYNILDSLYFFIGLLVFGLASIYGYRFCVMYTKVCAAAAIVLSVLSSLSALGYAAAKAEYYNFWNGFDTGIGRIFFKLFNAGPLYFNGLYLVIPLCAVLLYKQHGKIAGAAASAVLFLAAVSGAIARPFTDYILAAVGSVIVVYLILAAAAIGKRKELAIPFLAAGIAAAMLAGFRGEVLREGVELCFHPEMQATSRWNDGYNSVLIKELLGRAEFVGEAECSDEEWMAYGTGDWYFKNGEDADFMPSFHYKGESPTLEDVLPQHYLNNYRIAYVILKYGWGMGVVLLALLAALSGALFATTFRIKNRLGFLLAFGNSLLLSLQMVLYVAGNFGYQFGKFGNLPFISEGRVSVVVNMILAGLVLSAYRYDRVTDERRIGQNRKREAAL